ncbi:helix-turn-helix transcriptional regulator [Streptomyces sp. YIM 98790]|uniref:helix-turn-helix domain-containing protein n=1 Tax=Streptomyces sp. YIM 98790 TaxID=2689077 RepID=UPI0014092C0C|nr:helix-turn-helix transcriptional regulator [Streptomyces sp. YIM 98790]
MTEETAKPPPSLLEFFAREIRELRTAEKLTQRELAAKANISQSLLARLEGAERVPSIEVARALDRALGTRGTFERLCPLISTYAYPDWFLPFVEMEREAVAIQSYVGHVVPGLLQTEEYARELYSTVRPDNLTELVAGRMTRQEVFEKDPPPQCWFIIDEFALMRLVGRPEITAAQLARLLERGQQPRIVIQIVPRSTARHPNLDGNFTLFRLPDREDALHIDGYLKGRMAVDPREVAAAEHTYDLLRAVALPPDESATLIKQHMTEWSSHHVA